MLIIFDACSFQRANVAIYMPSQNPSTSHGGFELS